MVKYIIWLFRKNGIKSYFIFLFLGNAFITCAQDASMENGAQEARLPIAVEPSPNSTSLVRGVSENVDLYTGRLGVGIPLISLRSGEIDFNISLQGNVNSHRVNDIASWVGMGWNLNAGGSITRVMKSLPDEYNNARISSESTTNGIGYLNLKTTANVDLTKFDEGVPVANFYTLDQNKDIVNKGAWNCPSPYPTTGYDLEPDEYYFSAGSISGKFVFDQDGNPVIITDMNVKISKTIVNGKITAFSILSDDGKLYEFGNYSLNAVEESRVVIKSETALFSYPYTSCTGTVSSELFTKSGSPNFNAVNNISYRYNETPLLLTAIGPEPSVPSNVLSKYPSSSFDFDLPYNTKEIEYYYYPSTWHLTRITAPSGDFISFNYASETEKNYISDYTLNANFPLSASGQTPQTSCGTNGQFTGPEFYSYLPPKYSYNVIYNNAPTALGYFPSNLSLSVVKTTSYIKSCKLIEINTSGGAKVSFQANTARQDFIGASSLDKILYSNGIENIKEFRFNYSYSNSAEAEFSWNFNCKRVRYDYATVVTGGRAYSGTTFVDYTLQKIIPTANEMRKRLFLESIVEVGVNGLPLPPYVFEYFNKDNLAPRTKPNGQDYCGFNVDKAGDAPKSGLFAGVLKKITYPTGGYKEFVLSFSGNSNTWNGLKIDKIIESPLSGSENKETLYTYGSFNQTDLPPTSYKMPDFVKDIMGTSGGFVEYFVITERRFDSWKRPNNGSSTNGAAGGYNFVEVKNAGNGKYKIEYFTYGDFPDLGNDAKMISKFIGNGSVLNFTNPTSTYYRSSASNYNLYPFTPVSTNDYKRGLPKKETYYNELNAIQKTIEYTYDWSGNSLGYYKAIGVKASKYRVENEVGWNWLIFGKYTYGSRWKILKTQKVTQFDAKGNSIIEDRVYNYKKTLFSNKEYLYPESIEVLNNSKLEKMVSKYKMPIDYTFTTGGSNFGILKLQQSHVLSNPIETYTYTQNNTTGVNKYIIGQLTEYHLDRPTPKTIYKYMPGSNTSSFTASSSAGTYLAFDAKYQSVLSIDKYNTFNRVLEKKAPFNIPESYIWDSKNNYPIAIVSNALSNEIYFDGIEDATGWSGTYATSSGDKPAEFDNTKSRTGRYSGRITKTTTGERYCHSNVAMNISLSAATKYKYSGWVYSNGPSVDIYFFMYKANETAYYTYLDFTTTSQTGKWTYIEKEFLVPADVKKLNIRVDNNGGGIVWFDDLRIHPSNARMSSYTYEPFIGMTSKTDPNHQSEFYTYDGYNRLAVIRDDNNNILKTICYNYNGTSIPCSFDAKYVNEDKTGPYFKDNCSGGLVGSAYQVSIPAGMFGSTISVADANAKAIIYGNDQARLYGGCISSSIPIYFRNTASLIGFNLQLNNLSTGIQYNFSLSPAGYSQIGSVPQGQYSVSFSKAGNSISYFYSAGCGFYGSGSSCSFPSITINSACYIFEISPYAF